PDFATLHLAIVLEWDQDPGAGFQTGMCDDSEDLVEIDYEVYEDGSDVDLVDALGDPCVDVIALIPPTVDADKLYTLNIRGGDEGFLDPSWMAVCTGLKPGVGMDGRHTCQVANDPL